MLPGVSSGVVFPAPVSCFLSGHVRVGSRPDKGAILLSLKNKNQFRRGSGRDENKNFKLRIFFGFYIKMLPWLYNQSFSECMQ